MVVEIVLFIVGLLLLYFGAEGMVEGSSALALKWGVRPLVVGLTVVAFGTSAPELLVCLVAAFEENTSDISVGNIIGSNIANILLILGCASLVKPIKVHTKAIRREFPIMLAAVVLFAILLFFDEGQPELSRYDGILLAVAMAGYLIYSFFLAKSESPDDEAEPEEDLDLVDEIEDVDPDEANPTIETLKVVGGMIGLALGAYLMVESAKVIADQLGVPQSIIGISIVALGTSLPELATSVVAAVQDESDISVGNVIGSNIFNVLLVLGTVSIIAPLVIQDPNVLDFDLWFVLGVSIGIWPVLRTGHKISRWEGGAMLVLYACYIAFLFMR